MTILLSDLASHLGCSGDYPDQAINHVHIDSRKINQGDVFVAIKGPNHDGHDFLTEVAQQGAIAAVVSNSRQLSAPSTLKLLPVSDTIHALGQIARYHQLQFDCKRVALTGSCGKTTTKTLIAEILQCAAPTLANRGTLNNEFGVPLTLLDMSASHQYAVIECGANHKGEIAYLIGLVQPDVVLITNIAPVHIEGFGSLEAISQAKGEIISGLSDGGIAVLPGDDKFFPYFAELAKGHKIIRFGISEDNDIYAKNIHLNDMGQASFVCVTPKGEMTVELKLLVDHSVLNALAAAAVTYALDIPLTTIQAGLQAISSVDKRMVLKQHPQGTRVIDDSYNANPTAAKSVLTWLSQCDGVKVFVLGDMAELGVDEEKIHYQVGELAKSLGIDYLFTVGKLSQHTTYGFGENAKHFLEQHALIHHLRNFMEKDMTVLIKGSRSAKMENVVSAILEN